MQKVVGVVGSNGFIGKHLIRVLEQAKIEVLGFNSDNLPLSKSGELNVALLHTHSLIWCASKVNPAIAENSPDAVAFELNQWKTFLSIWGRNAKTKTIPIIFISSGGCVYSGKESPFTETTACFGINAYGIMKSRMEESLTKTDIPYKILRVANVYGPGQPVGRGQGVIAEWVNAIRNDKSVEVYGSLQAFRDFIHIDDVAAAIVSCIRHPSLNGVFNIGSGKATTLQEVLDLLSKHSTNNLSITHHEARTVDRLGYFLDTEKALIDLKWQPKIHLSQGLLSCLHPEVITSAPGIDLFE